ncbi:MAG TPA: DNA adenine methylase [Allosphingosinicella sp.]|nr:DNA adenine methylase [Allosphingosinicella sp.]
MTAPTRPLLRYLGSKWRLARWIIAHMPASDIYVEAFGGAAAVMLQRPPVRTEVWNDLDGELVNLFRVLRSPEAMELIRQVALTPYARAEYLEAHLPAADPLERARRLLIRSHMGHGTRGTRIDRAAGFRSDGKTGGTRVAGEWADFPGQLARIVERFRGVSLDNKPASALIEYWDASNVLLYLDPPYLPETRSDKAKQAEGYHTYAHEMTAEEHLALIDQACRSRSMVLISGYESPLYDGPLAAAGWSRRTTGARAHRNAERTEVLWINPLAAERLAQPSLFPGACGAGAGSGGPLFASAA